MTVFKRKITLYFLHYQNIAQMSTIYYTSSGKPCQIHAVWHILSGNASAVEYSRGISPVFPPFILSLPPFKVYEMLTGRERDEVKLMAVVVAVYYTQFMLRAKETCRLKVFC